MGREHSPPGTPAISHPCEIATPPLSRSRHPGSAGKLEAPAENVPAPRGCAGGRDFLIKSLKLTNFLSFGPESPALELGPLNVLIGANGSGKSNFLAAFDILRNAPNQIGAPIREGGGIQDWLWKGKVRSEASIEMISTRQPWRALPSLRYRLSFTAIEQSFVILSEYLDDAFSGSELYKFSRGYEPLLSVEGEGLKPLHDPGFNSNRSIFAQRQDPNRYPEMTFLGRELSKINLYREWSFGKDMPARWPQKADLPTGELLPSGENLALVLSRLGNEPLIKKHLLEALHSLSDGIDDFYVKIEGGTVLAYLREGARSISATRLSDGTLRYLCLLVILCDPNPPPLVCIEEPELGLHPDVLPGLARLLREASERCQLIVTTHSDILIDALSDTPECVIVCEKGEGGTQLRRLNGKELAVWLEEYGLGDLWIRGKIGGKRW